MLRDYPVIEARFNHTGWPAGRLATSTSALDAVISVSMSREIEALTSMTAYGIVTDRALMTVNDHSSAVAGSRGYGQVSHYILPSNVFQSAAGALSAWASFINSPKASFDMSKFCAALSPFMTPERHLCEVSGGNGPPALPCFTFCISVGKR